MTVTEYRMPKVNTNDAAYTLLGWLVEDGGKVAEGEPLLEVETSKAVEELAAPADGLLELLVPAGRECAPGELLARLHPDASSLEEARRPPAASADSPAPRAGGPVLTAPARARLAELGIPEAAALALDVPVVRRAEVDRLAARLAATEQATTPAAAAEPLAERSAPTPRNPGAPQAPEVPQTPQSLQAPADPPGTVLAPLSRNQRAVAATVTASHREVPTAFTAVDVDVTDALAAGRQLAASVGSLVGLAELTAAALATRRATDPACFAALTADGTGTRLVPGAHIGVTFELGAGLFVPVLHDADRSSLGELSRAMMGHRMAALRGAFRDRDLQGANITLTLHTDPGVALALPVVFPGQACALSLAAPRTAVLPDPDGTGFRTRSLVHLGAAFDHRLLNGRQVVSLLTGMKALLEAPHQLAGDAR
ncbi:dihydrolipoamide acetyltransferase component of pyruvate dehydrogenase complex [Kitasatospora phosalacinea]|uniref:Dihydrolipoamide acetyltransferase component of pyruvate dehydrogenase complex n=1 Tax=Kitasatospora phosalacinea TaxID=2065 RepID=A0A9W6Q3P3_9ACTN|nr:2-oxo acid dehydrogenase subunit E2 [Kitasatospora phosalacinea]GLW69314.1 dihydrolipoamide acetyltransferase component of pyruvate dehydrogenase complex [Kitasatospora phosalacinea]